MLGLLPLPLLLTLVLAAEHKVTVGGSANEFTPQFLQEVKVNDFVTFNFTTAGHIIAQTNLTAPCALLTDGFNSPPSQPGSLFTIQVTSISSPIFYACATATHCQSGAVGGINAANFSNALVLAAPNAPAGGFANVPPSGSPLGSGVSARVGTSPSAAGSSSRLSAGAVVGIVAVGFLLLIGAALVVRHWIMVTRLRRAHKRTAWKRRLEKRISQAAANPPPENATDSSAPVVSRDVEDLPRM
ncbi:hypothetical protein AURDEDRAFT_160764 [Auricularia subglabra TFB-10046 SS5]|nr:hypothetical protein AURDEDRAFT_160764 [Auricularia subglabra TFB-10046 SS5]